MKALISVLVLISSFSASAADRIDAEVVGFAGVCERQAKIAAVEYAVAAWEIPRAYVDVTVNGFNMTKDNKAIFNILTEDKDSSLAAELIIEARQSDCFVSTVLENPVVRPTLQQ